MWPRTMAALITQLLFGTLSADVGDVWFDWYGTVRTLIVTLWVGAVCATLFWAVAIHGSERERATRHS